MSWSQIADRMGICDTRVVQIHQRAIEKIRAAIEADPELLDGFAELMNLPADRLRSALEASRDVHYPPYVADKPVEQGPRCFGRGRNGYERKPEPSW